MLFGRERELEILRAAIARGTGALLRICGEPGIGKTTLADAAFEEARARGLSVHWARAWRGSPAFEALGLAATPGPSREATFEAWRRALEMRGPALIVIDDLHEADSDSLDLLAWIAPQLRPMRALLLVTERSASTGADAEIAAKLAKLARHATTMELGPLSRGAVGELIAQSTGQSVDDRLVEAVHRGTGGNALFIDGVVRAAVRDGTLTSGTIRFPRDVEQVIAERVTGAGDATALRVGAIIARPFTASVVASVLARSPLEVTDLLERACEEQLLLRTSDGTYAFRHPLVGEAIAASIDAASRAELHAAVAGVIAGSPSELAHHHASAVPIVSATIAIASCTRAAEFAAANTAHEEEVRWRRAVVSLRGDASDELALGRAILRAGRNEDARAAFTRAAERADAATLCEIALAFADTGEFGAVDAPKLALLRQARMASEPETALGIRVRARLGAELWSGSATREEANALTQDAIASARALGDSDLIFAALDCRFQSLWGPETLDERIALAAELGTRAQRIDDRLSATRRALLVAAERGDVIAFERELGTFAELASRLARPSLDETVMQRRLWLTLVRGDLDQAERLTKEIYDLDLRIQNPQAEMGRRFALSAIALAKSDVEALRALTKGFAEDVERLSHLPFIRARIAQIAAHTGDRDLASRELPRAIRDLRARAGDLVTLAGLSFTADAAAVLGDRAAAAEIHPLLLPHRRLFASIGASLSVISVAHAIGLVEKTLGDPNAQESFREALAMHRAMNAPLLIAETERELAEPVAPTPSQRASLSVRDNEVLLRWNNTEHRLKRSRGLELLATLLARPHQLVHVLTLSGAEPLPRSVRERSIDAEARATYAKRLAELREAEEDDPRVRAEREALEDEIARASRPRATDEGEKARVAVAKALRRAFDAIAVIAPSAADHLERNVRTGYECSYDPPPDGPIAWDVTM